MKLHRAVLFVALCVTFQGILSQGVSAQSNGDKFRYQFRTVFIPDPSGPNELEVKSKDAWLSGKRVPKTTVRLSDKLVIQFEKLSVELPAGTTIIMADGEEAFGCEESYRDSNLWTYKRLCFADFDKDGAFESFQVSNDSPMTDAYAQTEQRKDFMKMEPVRYAPVSVPAYEEIEFAYDFFATHNGKRFKICLGAAPYDSYLSTCFKDNVKLQPADEWQRFEHRGGVFLYRQLPERKLSIRIEKNIDPFEY